ncbi:MAG: ABC transporter permease [Cyclobacteriaceae bacterium]
MTKQPPKLARKILLGFLREDLAEEVLGDLAEKFYLLAKNKSMFRAKLNYWYQVLNYIRPFAIRKSKSNHSNLYAMFQHNILISFRNFKKFKGSFLINLAGLSTGLACALLIYLWVNDELSIDKFHEQDSQLYQVLKTVPQADGTVTTMAHTPAAMAPTMAEDLPEVEYAVSVLPPRDNGIISAGDRHVKAKHQFAGEDYFKVFSYHLIQGNEEKALTDKYGVLLSEELALKLFNTTENIVGKMVEWEWWDKFNGTYTVAGVFANPPPNSSTQFDIIFSHSLWVDIINDTCWCSNNADTYLILKKGTDTEQFNNKIRNYSKTKLKELEGPDGLKWEGTLAIQRFSNTYLYNHYENGVQAGGRIAYVKLFSIIGLAILVIACINFMNLSTAKASRRVKEVGIKKVVGAQRMTLILQYIGESMIMTLLSLVIAMVLVNLLLPAFREITGKGIILNFDINLLLSLAGITLITGIISGSYPALYLSGFSPALVLKGQMKTSGGESWLRKGLVIFQFTISVVLIVSVMVVYKQIEFIQSKNLGYNKDNIIRFANEGKLRRGVATFLTEVKKMPGVVSASTMAGDMVGNHSGGGGINWEGKTQGIEFSGLYVDHNLLEMLGVEMVEGRTFSPESGSDLDKVIFNETAISMMRLIDPIGKTVNMWGKEKQIIGVVKDFHYESLYENVGPFFFACTENNPSTVIKIKAGMEKETIDRISKFYREYNEGLPFDYQFLDQDYQTLYAAENRVSILSRYFAGVAILISCLGLFGLAAFTAERRTKEIGIRKVLGSSVLGIVYLLTSDFTKIVFVSLCIALPSSFFLVQEWLNSFAFRIELEWWYFTGAGLATLLIAWLTVGIQTVKAANINPARCLKNE